jgi:AraC-like DNA-binding protein
MPVPITFDVRVAILAHHQHEMSCRKITETLLGTGMTVSASTVLRVIRKYESKTQTVTKPVKRLGIQCLSSKPTKSLIRKVDRATDKADPPTLKQLAQRYEVSRRTVQWILKDDLGEELRKKTRTHALSNKQMQQRLDRGRRFLQLIGGNHWKYIISLDEAWLSMNDSNRIRDVYYKKQGKKTPQTWTKKWKQKYAKQVIFAAGVSSRGVTGLYFVPPTSKVDHLFFINKILKPIMEKDIPRLYSGEERKVILHFDSATSHTTPTVYQYLDDHNVTYIRKEE